MSLFQTDLIDDPDLLQKRNRSSRIPDLAFGAVLPLGMLSIAGFPLNEIAAILMLGIAFMRRPRFHLPVGTLVLLAALWLGLAASAEVNGLNFPVRRMGHMAIWAGLIIAIGQGRINLMSMARGVGLGIVVALPISLPSIVSGGYAGRLTGLFGDPNLAGMSLVTLGPWAIGIIPGKWKWPVAAAVFAAIILTYSRTSLLALAIVIVWVVMARKVSMWLAVAILAPTAIFLSQWLETVRLWGPFENRSGSDMLRERINAAAAEMLAVTPWYGNGPGTATVKVERLSFFLHNSYDAVRLEGGWWALTIVLALTAMAFIRAATGPHEQRHPWFEGAQVAVLVCALNLGEVLFEVQFAANLGALLLVGSVQRNAVVEASLLDNVNQSRIITATRTVDDDAFIAKLQRAGTTLTDRAETPSTLLDSPDSGLSRLLDTPGELTSRPFAQPGDRLLGESGDELIGMLDPDRAAARAASRSEDQGSVKDQQ